MDYSRILNKPFFIQNYTWTNAITNFTEIGPPVFFPSQIMKNDLIKIPFKASTLFRARACFMLQVSGTPMHQGLLVATTSPIYSPYGYNTSEIKRLFFNNALAPPHVFLSANNSTSACLEIPFYYNNKLDYCDIDLNVPQTIFGQSDYAQLTLLVVNQLQMPDNASTSVTVSVHVVFKELEFYSPHVDVTYRVTPQIKILDPLFGGLAKSSKDFIDAAISSVRAYTGLHNENKPLINDKMYGVHRNDLNNVDQETKLEKLDPFGNYNRKISDYVFNTKQDEMDLQYIFKKPYYIGTFNVNNTTPLGAVLFSKPISPWMENIVGITNSIAYTFPLSAFYRMARFWRGSLKIHIQSNMTAFHYVKLIVARNYSPNIDYATKYPNFNDVQNLLTETIEFSSGGLIQTIELPYISPYNQIECVNSPLVNALSHGIFHIFLAQPLVLNGTVAQNVNFNVYLSAGDDFVYFGYPNTNFVQCNFPGILPTLEEELLLVQEETKVKSAKSIVFSDNFNKLIDLSDDIAKIYKVDKQTNSDQVLPFQTPVQQPILTEFNNTANFDDTEFRPLLNIRDIFRRFYQADIKGVSGINMNSLGNRFVVYDIAEMLGLVNTEGTGVALNPLQYLFKNYFGFVGGIKFKFKVMGATNASVKFIPPATGGSLEITSKRINSARVMPVLSGLGATAIVTAMGNNFQALYGQEGCPFPNVGVEASNYLNTVSYNTSSYGEDNPYFLSSSSVLIEGVVPYMNNLSFVGDMTRAFQLSNSTRYMSSDLGQLVISFTPVAGTDGATSSNLRIIPYIGLSDESRLGFNTISLPVFLQNLPIGDEFGILSPFNNTTAGATAYVDSNYSLAPAAYYSNGI